LADCGSLYWYTKDIIERTKIKKYVVYFAGFLGGVGFFIAVPIVVVYLFTLGVKGSAVISIVPILMGTIVIYVIVLFLSWKKSKTVFRVVLSSLLFTVLLFGLVNFYITRQSSYRNTSEIEGRRVSDLKRFQRALDFYYEENNSYPIAGAGCQDTSSLEILVPDIIATMPHEVKEAEGHPSYQYASLDGSQYVLKATFENAKRPALETDLDGIILGCDCDDPNYCVGSNLINNN